MALQICFSYSQAELLRAFGHVNNGVCWALSLLWCSSLRHTNATAPQPNAFALSDRNMVNEANILQRLYSARFGIDRSTDMLVDALLWHQASARDMRSSPAVKMQWNQRDTIFGTLANSECYMVSYQLQNPQPGISDSAGGHCVAVGKFDNELFFFDPNYGQYFGNSADIIPWLRNKYLLDTSSFKLRKLVP